MNDFNVKSYVSCNTGKVTEIVYNKASDCKPCNIKRVLKRYYI